MWHSNSLDHIIINMDKLKLVQTLDFSTMAHLLSIFLNPCIIQATDPLLPVDLNSRRDSHICLVSQHIREEVNIVETTTITN
jgi:hypothetical protein